MVPRHPWADAQLIGGSYGTWNAIAKLEGQGGAVNYVLAGNRFETDGYRDHSTARRNLANVKLRLSAAPDTSITLIANSLYQPDAQDPLGLTRAQWQANPQQADPAATNFNTRKTVSQLQGGTTIEQRFSADTDLRVTAYGGSRQVRQYLALPGTAITSSGGVTDLDRTFGGVDARMTTRFSLAGRPAALTLGADYESEREHRQGFANNGGALGDQRRDEDNTLTNTDGYLQIEWTPLDRLSLFAGVRYSDVRFESADHFIVGANGNDSGQSSYNHPSPVFGLVWHALDDVNVYANYGEGFETPTFTELAYRNVGSGLNLGLQPSVSHSAEIGLKALFGRQQRANLAFFNIETSNEIVIDAAVGGRTTYKNATNTRRRGVEAAWQGDLGAGIAGYASYTWLSATFSSAATTGVPPSVPEGARLPGVPAASAYGEITWSYPAAAGLTAGLEVQYAGRMYVNDRNTDFAPAYTIGNAADRLRADHGPLDAARIRAAQQHHQRELRGHCHRRRCQHPVFRAGGHAQFPGRGQRQCDLLTRSARYTGVAIALHWLIALLVIGQFAWGWWMQDIPKQPVGPRVDAFNLHKSVGMTIFALMVIRLLWRIGHRPPPLPPMAAWQATAARANARRAVCRAADTAARGVPGLRVERLSGQVLRDRAPGVGGQERGAEGPDEHNPPRDELGDRGGGRVARRRAR